MDEISYEEFNKGKNNLVGLLVAGLIIIGLALGMFTTFKQETLVCDAQKDKCYVQKTNFAGLKYKKKLINMSDIKDVTYIPQSVKGNRYAKGYTSYFLTFIDKNNNRIIVFSTYYYEKDEVYYAIKNLKKQLAKKNNTIILKRN